ncbi:MAG: hypothetical protein H6607_10830 [Flavobacteriales bacterium]|nr:hypothetical protein [Flavobacteriales bacterium]
MKHILLFAVLILGGLNTFAQDEEEEKEAKIPQIDPDFKKYLIDRFNKPPHHMFGINATSLIPGYVDATIERKFNQRVSIGITGGLSPVKFIDLFMWASESDLYNSIKYSGEKAGVGFQYGGFLRFYRKRKALDDGQYYCFNYRNRTRAYETYFSRIQDAYYSYGWKFKNHQGFAIDFSIGVGFTFSDLIDKNSSQSLNYEPYVDGFLNIELKIGKYF